MRKLTVFVIYLYISFYSIISMAGTMNPCEYMNAQVDTINRLDTGNDDNFERMKQRNNQQMVLACQEYEIKRLQIQKIDTH